MKIETFADVASTAQAAADYIADEAHAAIQARGRFTLAVSGGSTPSIMFRALADINLPWTAIHIIQVDERVAPAGDSKRNLTHLQENLLNRVPLPPGNIHAMPVEASDLESAVDQYAQTLRQLAGPLPILDLVHLGLGPDGHTASLVPGDPVLNVNTSDIALSGIYQGNRRMTMTYPILNRARQLLWLVTGSEKAPMLPRLVARNPSIPAGAVHPQSDILFADHAAAAKLSASK
jgi:6-phosphogluconolactonase